MGFLQRIKVFFQKEKKKEPPVRIEEKVFSDYISQAVRVLTYFRRKEGIPKKNLELTVIDTEEQPAWKVEQVLEELVPEVRLLYFLTDREEYFEGMQEEVFEATGLLMVFYSLDRGAAFPGNLVLDLRDWENQLDIVKMVGYNTMATV